MYELVTGGSLWNALYAKENVPGSDGFLPAAARLGIAADIASGLSALHEVNEVHRDLKPDNVLLRPLPDGSYEGVLIDLTIAREIEEGSQVSTFVQGNPLYRDPQSARPQSGLLHPRGFTHTPSDMYSFAVVLLDLLEGCPALCATGERRPRFAGDYFPSSSWLEKRARWSPQEYVTNQPDHSGARWAPGVRLKLFELAKACLSEDVHERPRADEAVRLLAEARAGATDGGSSGSRKRKRARLPVTPFVCTQGSSRRKFFAAPNLTEL